MCTSVGRVAKISRRDRRCVADKITERGKAASTSCPVRERYYNCSAPWCERGMSPWREFAGRRIPLLHERERPQHTHCGRGQGPMLDQIERECACSHVRGGVHQRCVRRVCNRGVCKKERERMYVKPMRRGEVCRCVTSPQRVW